MTIIQAVSETRTEPQRWQYCRLRQRLQQQLEQYERLFQSQKSN